MRNQSSDDMKPCRIQVCCQHFCRLSLSLFQVINHPWMFGQPERILAYCSIRSFGIWVCASIGVELTLTLDESFYEHSHCLCYLYFVSLCIWAFCVMGRLFRFAPFPNLWITQTQVCALLYSQPHFPPLSPTFKPKPSPRQHLQPRRRLFPHLTTENHPPQVIHTL